MTSGSVLDGLFPALKRLDQLIAQAVTAVQAGSGPNRDPFRGLHIGPDDVARWLGREPGAPVFDSAAETPTHTDFDDIVNDSPRFAWLVRTFGLSSFDLGIVVIALAPEVDLRYEGLYAYLQDDVTRRRPSVDLALNLLCSSPEDKLSRRGHFGPESALLWHRLLHLISPPNRSEAPLTAHTVRLDAQIVDVLLGQNGLDRRLASFCETIWPSVALDTLPLDEPRRQYLATLFRSAASSRKPLRLYFHGSHGIGKRRTAEALAGAFGKRFLHVDLGRMQFAEVGFEEAVRLTFREAWLQDAVLYLDNFDSVRNAERAVPHQHILKCLADHSGVAILAGAEPWVPPRHVTTGVLEVHFSPPDLADRRSCWQSALAGQEIVISDSDLDTLAGRFSLTQGQIAEAVTVGENHAICRTNGDEPPTVTLSDLAAAARAQSGHELASLARKVEPVYTWDDIVLPEDSVAQLRELCARVTQGPRVFGEWGFGPKLSQGKGANALFAGPSGTGKTMAAEIIANELGLDLYKIDLSGVVSKYIGETEKNLDRIFRAAENANAILFFDEADALFGKRSEVRDSHDRYANIEISYLLQKMEQYEGVAILATNLRQSLDEAFVRRLAFTVHFPFPGEEDRCRIWTSVWPDATPQADDVDVDLLARQFKLSGGNIKNVALAAAFFAANDGGAVTMRHLLHATQREYQKMGKTLTEAELNGPTVVPLEGKRA
jgi:SpoVK/Ycf46/Vps4 family AAA+-type ATPase